MPFDVLSSVICLFLLLSLVIRSMVTFLLFRILASMTFLIFLSVVLLRLRSIISTWQHRPLLLLIRKKVIRLKLNNETFFEQSPVAVDQSRSTFDWSHNVRDSGKCGDLMLLQCKKLYPGQTEDVHLTTLLKTMTPLTPTMDNAFWDEYAFFVPQRLVWSHSKEFFGENNTSYWTDQWNDLTIPNVNLGSVAAARTDGIHDYFQEQDIPYLVTTGSAGTDPDKLCVDILPLRAIALTFNEWFRDQNTQPPIPIDTGDTGLTTNLTTYYINRHKVNRVHDLFGSCVPEPQKGDAVKIALDGTAMVLTSNNNIPVLSSGTYPAMKLGNNQGSASTGSGTAGMSSGTFATNSTALTGTVNTRIPINLQADLSSVGINVEDLRLGLLTQHVLEILAAGGSRYCEILRSLWGVISPDARMQRPELIAHARKQLNMQDVVQTSATVSGSTPQGHEAGRSKTVADGLSFSYSSIEHGYLLIFGCLRTARSYCQGIPAALQRLTRFEHYMPQLANIGMQPVYKREIFLNDPSENSKVVFGYNEPWHDLKAAQNHNRGLLNPDYPAASGGLGQIWTYGDVYASSPTLSASWMAEDSSRFGRTLAVQNTDQFMIDCWMDWKTSLSMPVFSLPGVSMRI